MKAIQMTGYGGSEVLELVGNIPAPTVADGQVLVEVRAASLNAFDWKLRAGQMKERMPLAMPFRLGMDLAGVVRAVGAGVTAFAIGDEVYGQSNGLAGGSGAFAEQAVTKPALLAKKPRSVTMIEAAALPLAGVSALQALTEHLKLQADQSLLITGGAGGIGSLAIPFAKTLGVRVTATVLTAKDGAFATARGADTVVNVTEQSFATIGMTYDAIFDTVGGDARADAMRTLKAGGTIVSMVGKDDELATELGLTAIGQVTQVTSERLMKLAQLIDNHTIKPNVTMFPPERVRDAFDALEQGKIQGKAVLDFDA